MNQDDESELDASRPSIEDFYFNTIHALLISFLFFSVHFVMTSPTDHCHLDPQCPREEYRRQYNKHGQIQMKTIFLKLKHLSS